jgi:hypothetical protein
MGNGSGVDAASFSLDTIIPSHDLADDPTDGSHDQISGR